jgi:hypothetical protein
VILAREPAFLKLAVICSLLALSACAGGNSRTHAPPPPFSDGGSDSGGGMGR